MNNYGLYKMYCRTSNQRILLRNRRLCAYSLFDRLNPYSSGTGILQQLWELAFLGLKIRVSTNVLLLDEDVWDGTLTSQTFESILNSGSII